MRHLEGGRRPWSRSVGLHARRSTRQIRAGALAGASLTFAALALTPTLVGTADAGAVGGGTGPTTKSVTAVRDHIDPVTGLDDVVESRTVSVTVGQTTGLRNRQAVSVSWTGAHPTGGRVTDSNSTYAAQQEYPVVVMQCRGVDTSVASISPGTCWTSDPQERWGSDPTFLYPPFRVDRYATASDRKAFVGVVSPLPSACLNAVSGAQHWVPFVAADKTVYAGACADSAPEAGGGSDLAPSNTTYGFTRGDGTGATSFIMNSAEANASLGCSDTVKCSLVVVPIAGISCDVVGAGLPKADQVPKYNRVEAQARCTKSGSYAPGTEASGSFNVEDYAVSGLLWWSASNWRNHLSFPLTFAPPSNVCDIVSSSKPVYLYGSQAMTEATLQWAPAFCTDPKLFKFQHVQFTEPGSRSLLDAGSVQAALVAGPPQQAFTKPVVQAPIAVSGFAIAYQVDDVLKQPATDIKLTPRLLAKLLTMSYPSGVNIRSEYQALANNPLDIIADPEFRGLNQGMMDYTNGYVSSAASTLYAMASDSDVMWALTSYINADPSARAWLDGTPDPWGMSVNPSYKGVQLPVTSWPIKDDFLSKSVASLNPCIAANPVPYLPLVAGPVSNPAVVTLNMQYGIANSQINCKSAGNPDQKLTGLGRLVPGHRAMFGLVSLADADRYQLPTAELLTHTDANAPNFINDTTGRTFVGASLASMKAAVSFLKPDAKAGTWLVDYAGIRGDGGKAAYPGTLLMSLDVPTKGVPASDAAKYAELLRFATGAGQVHGTDNGQLPDGYLPMTSANGAGSLVAYSRAAADAIAAQNSYVPALDLSSTPPPIATPTATPVSVPATGSAGGLPASTGGTSSATPSDSASQSTSVTPSPSPSTLHIVDMGLTKAVSPGPLGKAIPQLLVLALATGVGAVVTMRWGRS